MSAFPLLPRMVAARMFADLCRGLPPLPDDSPAERTERDLVAIAAILALGPIRDAEEASLAIAVVSADFHAREALQDAGQLRDSIKVVMQCRAQAMGMWRQRHRAAGRLAMLQARHPQPDEPAIGEPGIEAPIGADPTLAAPDRQPPASPPAAPPRSHDIDPYGRVPVRRLASDPLAGSLFADLFDDLLPSVDTGRSAQVSGTGRESHEFVI